MGLVTFLVPVTSRNLPPDVGQQPLVTALLPSLRNLDCVGVELLLGYDSDDPLWMRWENRGAIDFPGVKWVEIVGLSRNITGIWNAMAAMASGEYLMPLNDDFEFMTSPMVAIDVLRRRGNFGTVAFDDSAFPGLPTFFVTHRTHLDIFGHLYPLPWTGAHQDSWISDVYRPWGASEIDERVKCRNHVGTGSRFEYGGTEGYAEEVLRGRRVVNEWLRSHPVAKVLNDETLQGTDRVI